MSKPSNVHDPAIECEGTEVLKRLRLKLAIMFDKTDDVFEATKLADRISSLTVQLNDMEEEEDNDLANDLIARRQARTG